MAWPGQSIKLREHGVHWDAIDEAAEASGRPAWSTRSSRFTPAPWFNLRRVTPHERGAAAHDHPTTPQRRRVRRSHQFPAPRFFILHRLMPRAEKQQPERLMPWDLLPWDPAIHLLLFVHRVGGSDAGALRAGIAIRQNCRFCSSR